MPRKDRLPSYCHHKGSGQAYVRLSGVIHYLGKHGTAESKAAYDRLIAEWLAGGRHVPPTAKDRPTISQLILAWERHAEAYYPAGSRTPDTQRAALKPLKELYGDTLAAEFGPRALKAVQANMVAAGLSRGVVNRRCIALKGVFRWAESEELVPKGTYHALATVPGIRKGTPGVRETPPVRPTKREDLDAVLPHCRPPVAAMLELQWIAGMRSCEVRVMRAVDIDRTDAVWLYRPIRDKNSWRETHAPRVVPLGPECQKILAPWLEREKDPEAFLFRAYFWRPSCYTACSYSEAVRKACLKAGVKIIAYGGRHAAKRRVTREHGLDAARAFLGQSSLGTTNQYAIGQDLETAVEVAKKLG